jgi:hypothetical protein
MRVIKEFSFPEFKVTVFSWNNRYLLKLEQGLLEQTFKVDQFDVTDEQHLLKILDAEFVHHAAERFLEMNQSLQQALARNTP